MKYRPLLAVLATALLVLSLSGCGVTNHLETLTLGVKSGTNLGGGTYDLFGAGGTIQLQVLANYSNKQSLDVTRWSTYTISITPDSSDAFGHPLADPNAVPPQTVQLDKTGLLTAVTPFDCFWENLGTTDKPAWFMTGTYTVTATYKGVTSQPVYVAVASAAGPAAGGACGPTS